MITPNVPAFPTSPELRGGLTKREYYAAEAMKSLIILEGANPCLKRVAAQAWIQADALLEAEEK
jgi:hypothetical protein